MRFASLAGSLLVVLSTAALGAQGDHLVVTGNGVNVRAEPQAGAPVLLQVYRDDLAVEVGREGDWVEVRLPERSARGWIHGSLLSVVDGAGEPEAAAATDPAPPAAAPPAAAPPAAAPAPAAPETGRPQLAAVDGGDALTRFRDSVTYLNNRAVAAARIDLFTGVKSAGDGVVQVTATDAWKNVPRGGQDSFMRTLFDRWSAAAGGVQPLKVQVVDRSGQVLREKSEP
jgi:pyruvate/2-oxoglutarate dehydrogenase complex dihydrolipoamide acyltransferase (E2) component